MALMALAATVWQRLGWIADPADPSVGDPSTWGWRTLIGAVMLLAILAGFAFVAVIVPAQTLIQERALPEVTVVLLVHKPGQHEVETAELVKRQTDASIALFKQQGFRHKWMHELHLEGLRKAGLREE